MTLIRRNLALEGKKSYLRTEIRIRRNVTDSLNKSTFIITMEIKNCTICTKNIEIDLVFLRNR